jgi:hypothetical protein
MGLLAEERRPRPSFHVLGMGDGFEVQRVPAVPPSTRVVEL